MIKDHVARSAGVRRRTLLIVMALMAPLASLGLASPVLAEKVPTGEWAIFKQCPRLVAGLEDCLYSRATSGVVTINKLTVPIVNPLTLQGGFMPPEEGITPFVEALNGETFPPIPEPIPGGIASLIDCNEITGHGHLERSWRRTCKALFDNPWFFTRAYETTELAGGASEIILDPANTLNQVGSAIIFPVKFHLESPLLGRNCYIGSNAHPIILKMTTGTTNPPPPNKPASGHFGSVNFNKDFTFIENVGHAFIDNEFAAPEATGCGGAFSFVIDHLIDNRVGLPAPAGYNTIIHEGNTTDGFPQVVIESEEDVKTGKAGHDKNWHTKWSH